AEVRVLLSSSAPGTVNHYIYSQFHQFFTAAEQQPGGQPYVMDLTSYLYVGHVTGDGDANAGRAAIKSMFLDRTRWTFDPDSSGQCSTEGWTAQSMTTPIVSCSPSTGLGKLTASISGTPPAPFFRLPPSRIPAWAFDTVEVRLKAPAAS